jgi:hypothetical protein
MSQHILAKCYYGHYVPLDFNGYGYIDGRTELHQTEPKIPCPTCASSKYPPAMTKFYGITPYDKTFSFNEFKILRHSNYFSTMQDFLESKGFTLDTSCKNRNEMVYLSPEGFKAVFVGKGSSFQTETLYLLVPEKHSLIKEVDTTNKANKRAKKDATPAKPKVIIPETMQDAAGSEIKIGDWVAYSSQDYTDLKFGQIVKFNPKSVSIRKKGSKSVISGKSTSSVIKIPDEQAMLMLLEQ